MEELDDSRGLDPSARQYEAYKAKMSFTVKHKILVLLRSEVVIFC